MCGGWFLDQVNRPTTRCHDGRTAEQCYTPVLDWSSSGLSEAQQAALRDAAWSGTGQVRAMVRGTFAPTNSTTPQPALGRFIVTEAWLVEGEDPSSGQASGTFVWIRDNGLRCFAPPCPNLTERTLNTAQTTDIADVDFTASSLTDAEIEACRNELYGPHGLVVAGERYTVEANGNTAPGRTATAAYRRLPPGSP